MAFSDYTSPTSVRAVLGISVKEVHDATVTDTVYLTTLLETLYGLSPTLSADFLLTSAEPTPSPAEQRFVRLVETFCAYTVAVALIPSLPLAAPQIITDGKASVNRIANPYENLLPALNASLAYIKNNLMAAYAEIYPGISPLAPVNRTMVVNVGLAVDPITGV